MGSIKDEAKAYEQQTTKNIADLDKVDVSMDLETREGMDRKGESFKYKVTIIGGQEYRVPWKVLSDLKAILVKKPDLKSFSVVKQGEGMNTKYTVIPQE